MHAAIQADRGQKNENVFLSAERYGTAMELRKPLHYLHQLQQTQRILSYNVFHYI